MGVGVSVGWVFDRCVGYAVGVSYGIIFGLDHESDLSSSHGFVWL